MNYGKFEDFVNHVKSEGVKHIFFNLRQTMQAEQSTVVGDQIVTSPAIFNAAVVLTACSELNETKLEKKFFSHVYIVKSMKVPTQEAKAAWDSDLATTLSKLKSDLQSMAPGIPIVDGVVEVF
jgi:hypothetical protein